MIRIFAPVIFENDQGTVREWTLLQGDADDFETRKPALLDVTPGALYSIERPWLSNEPFSSRIPHGIYTIIPWRSHKHGPVWTLVGGTVSPYATDAKEKRAHRYQVLVHVANFPVEVEGCLGLGSSWSKHYPTGCPAVWNSKNAVDSFRRSTHGEPVMIAYLS
jgi:hypothetical protein